MDREQFEKNILDLQYQAQLQKLNAILIFASVGALGLVGSFIWNPDYLFYGFSLTAAVEIVAYLLYRRTAGSMEEILHAIKKIKTQMPKRNLAAAAR